MVLQQTSVHCIAKNFRWTKFRQAWLLLYCRKLIFGGIKFRQCGKGCHILYVITNIGQIFVDKAKIGKNFLLA